MVARRVPGLMEHAIRHAPANAETAAPVRRPPEHVRDRLRRWLLVCGVLLVVFGGKMIVLHHYGSDIPNWDQWDAEGEQLFVPYFQGRLGIRDFFEPHNEHRVVCTKLLALALLRLNGQWDARLECTANALLHAAFIAMLCAQACRLVAHRWQPVLLLAGVIVTLPTFAWQNVLSGFHSQQYFLLWFSVLAIELLLVRRPFTAGWWAGLACAFLALVSMASGLLAAATVVILLFLDRAPKQALRRHGVTFAVCAVVIALGWFTQVHVNYHESLKAHSPSEAVLTFWHSLQWPVNRHALYGAVAWLPWVWLCWRHWFSRASRDDPNPKERVVVAIGLWVLLQFAATAYARGAGGAWPASRYLDTVLLGIGVNLLALLLTLSQAGARWRKGTVLAFAAVWLAPLLAGLWREHASALRSTLPAVAASFRAGAANVRNFLVSGNPAHLRAGPIPYPAAAPLQERLAHPELRAILPAGVRPPLKLTGRAEPSESWAPEALDPRIPPLASDPSWGSFTKEGRESTGVWTSDLLPSARERFWSFQMAGDLSDDDGDVSLELQSEDGRTRLIAPGTTRGVQWHSAFVRAPEQPARLVARDRSTSHWLAFAAPVEMAAGSYYAWRITTLGPAFIIAGLLLAAAGLVMTPLLRTRDLNTRGS